MDEFDFEKNLALFDKKAVFEEIENNNPEVIRVGDKKPTKYRHDENVLQSKPTTFQQIKVPKDYGSSYVTGNYKNNYYKHWFYIELLIPYRFM
jgi:enhancer of mRNA-decapping protein 3